MIVRTSQINKRKKIMKTAKYKRKVQTKTAQSSITGLMVLKIRQKRSTALSKLRAFMKIFSPTVINKT